MRDLTPEQVKQAEQRWTVSANTPRVQYASEGKPPVIHVVTPESSSGKLWAEIQRLLAVEAESARTIAHLNQTHREVSEMQQGRIEELESVLAQIGDCREHPQCIHARLARAIISKSAGTKPEAL